MKKTVSFSKNSVNIFFHVLTRCNLRCRHCYINPDQHGDAIVPLTTAVIWLERFHQPGKRSNLILLGGEPTLHPDLDGIIHAARAIGYASITIDTNGYLFHNILEKVTPAEVDFFSFSLDGATAGTNDRIRGPGSFDRCVAGIREAIEKGFAASVIFTVSRENLEELSRMVPLLKKMGVARFFIQVIGIRGRSARPGGDALQLTQAEWEAHVPPVSREAAEAGITVTYPKVFLGEGDTFECAGNVAENYFIFPNGRVYRCPLCEDYPLHSLNVDAAGQLSPTGKINESDLFSLNIPEGCVINKLVQSGNLSYTNNGRPEYRIACCLLKEEVF